MDAMLIQLTNQKAVRLLHELEELHLIRVLKKGIKLNEPGLSEKYRGMISKEEGEKLKKHVNQMRNEWKNI